MQQSGLKSKNFILLLLGQLFSLAGNTGLKFAISMYVLEQTGSAAVFAGMLSAALLPTILLSPLGGILADRVNRRNLMVALDLLSGAGVLLALLLLPWGGVPLLGGLLILLSLLGALESPTVQACMPQLLEGDTLLRGNALVSQISALSGLLAPFAGSVLYAALGLKPILLGTAVCFLLTALLECFIRLDRLYTPTKQRAGEIIRQDFQQSLAFLRRQQPLVLRLLLLAAVVSFFAVGLVMVGFPFLVRQVLGLSARHYGAAESILGGASLLGSVAAGLAAGRLKTRKLHGFIWVLGLSPFPAGLIFLVPATAFSRYLMLLLCFSVGYMVCSAFSIFALSLIQQRTPQHLTGKVMALVYTISMCAQPLGQLVYGLLFDKLRPALVLLPSGLLLGVIAFLSMDFFHQLEQSGDKNDL